MRESVLPRTIGDQSTFAERVKILPGIKVNLANVDDLEARELASTLNVAFSWANWTTEKLRELRMWFPGVSICVSPGPRRQEDHSKEAAMLLLEC